MANRTHKAPGKPQDGRPSRPATRVPRQRSVGLGEPGERIQGDAMKERLHELALKVAKLGAWGGDLSYVKLLIRLRRTTKEPGSSGNSWPDDRKITMLVGTSEADAIGVLIHEYAHHAMFRRGWKEEGHGVRFLDFERAAYEEYLGERLQVKAQDAQAYGGTGLRHHRYAQLGAFIRQLKARLAEQRRSA